MGTDFRCRHDVSLLVEAARLHDAGLGRRAIGTQLGVSHATVREWLGKYRTGGTEPLLKMGGNRRDTTLRPRPPRRAPWSTARRASPRRRSASVSRTSRH